MTIHPHQLARRDDPATSKQAATEVAASGEAARQRNVVLAAVCRFPGLTSCELAARGIGLDRYQIARRLPELEGEGLVRKGPARSCTVTDNKAHTWELVEVDMERKRCKTCDAEILWAKTPAGKAMPLDADPVPTTHAGTKCVVRGGVACFSVNDAKPDELWYVSHFATCPEANKHRKPKPSQLSDGASLGDGDGKARRQKVQQVGGTGKTTDKPLPAGFLFDNSPTPGDASKL